MSLHHFTSSKTRNQRSPKAALGAAALAATLVVAACGGGAAETVEASGPSLGGTAALPADAGPGWDTSTTTVAQGQTRTAAATTGSSAQPLADGAAPGAVLLRAAQDTRKIESFRFDLVASVSGLSDFPVDVGSLDIKVSGAQAANGDSQLVMDMTQMGELLTEAMAAEDDLGEGAAMAGMFLGMFNEPMEMRQIGDQSYLKMGGFLEMFGAASDKEWIVGDADQSDMGDDLGAMVPFIDTENPASILAAISGSGDVEVVGTENLDGVSTTHYRGALDPKAAESASTPEERQSIEDALAGFDFEDHTGVPIPTEIWVGDDGLVRRLRFSMDESHMAEAQDEDFEAITIDMRFTDLDEPITIGAPPANDVMTEQELSDGFDFGGDFGIDTADDDGI